MKKIIILVLIIIFLLGTGWFLYFQWLGSKQEVARDLLRDAREKEEMLVGESAVPMEKPYASPESQPPKLPPEPQLPVQTSEPPTSVPQEVQEFEIVETIYPGKFDPPEITVKKGIPVKIYLTTTQREHINRVSILPYITSSDIILPGQVTILEFTPTEIGNLEIRNIGHGFTGIIKVIN